MYDSSAGVAAGRIIDRSQSRDFRRSDNHEKLAQELFPVNCRIHRVVKLQLTPTLCCSITFGQAAGLAYMHACM
jgi:hypothetical protein